MNKAQDPDITKTPKIVIVEFTINHEDVIVVTHTNQEKKPFIRSYATDLRKQLDDCRSIRVHYESDPLPMSVVSRIKRNIKEEFMKERFEYPVRFRGDKGCFRASCLSLVLVSIAQYVNGNESVKQIASRISNRLWANKDCRPEIADDVLFEVFNSGVSLNNLSDDRIRRLLSKLNEYYEFDPEFEEPVDHYEPTGSGKFTWN